VARIPSDRCQACGICVAECPANAIVMRSYNPHELVARTLEALEGMGGRKAVAYIGGFCATAAEWRSEVGDRVPGVAEIYLSSTGGVSVAEVLHAFENGADAVAVITCKDATERYPTVALRTRRRVEQAQEMLKEIGISPARLQVFEVADAGRGAVREALARIAQEAARA